jgi:hypothetical protein
MAKRARQAGLKHSSSAAAVGVVLCIVIVIIFIVAARFKSHQVSACGDSIGPR